MLFFHTAAHTHTPNLADKGHGQMTQLISEPQLLLSKDDVISSIIRKVHLLAPPKKRLKKEPVVNLLRQVK